MITVLTFVLSPPSSPSTTFTTYALALTSALALACTNTNKMSVSDDFPPFFLLSPQNFLSLFVSFRFWIDYFLSCLSCVVRQEKTILTLFRNSQFFPLTSGLLFWEAALTVFVFGRHSNCLINCIGGCAAAASILTMHRNQYNNVCVTMSNI